VTNKKEKRHSELKKQRGGTIMKSKYMMMAVTLVLVLALSTSASTAQKPKIEIWGVSSFVADVNNWVVHKAKKWGTKNGVEVKVSLFPFGQLNAKLIAGIEAGTQPDMCVQGWGVGEWVNKGLLLPLDDVVDRLGRADFFEHKLIENQLRGHIYGIPGFFELFMLHIRTDLLKAAGLDYPNDYEEFAQVALKLTDPKNNFYGMGYSLGRNFDNDCHFLGALFTHGGGYLSEKSSKGVGIFKGESTIKALKWIKDLYDKKAIPPFGMVEIGNNNAYINGVVAMTLNPPSIMYALKHRYPELAAKTKMIPVGEIIDGGEESLFIFKSTKYPELAKRLAYYYFKDKEDYRKNFIEAGELYGLPIFKSQAKVIGDAWKRGEWSEWGVNPYELLKSIKYVSNPTAYPLGEASPVADRAMMSHLWARLVDAVIFEKVPIETAVEEAHRELKRVAKEVYGK
jgi:multiple sugar transport system substrate-binding protein